MIQKIIDEVTKAYWHYDGLDEIKRGIRLAMAISGLEWTDEEYHRIVDAVMYKLADRAHN
jgi:hypothetical protein